MWFSRCDHRNLQNWSVIILYLPVSDWFGNKRTCQFVFQINLKMVNTIWFRFDLIRFRKKYLCVVLHFVTLLFHLEWKLAIIPTNNYFFVSLNDLNFDGRTRDPFKITNSFITLAMDIWCFVKSSHAFSVKQHC